MKLLDLLAATAVCAGCATGASATVIGGVEFPDGAASFADSVYSYSAGSGFPSAGACQDASQVIGAPDFINEDVDCEGYLSLGQGGSVVLQFTDNALTTSGDGGADLHVFEVGSAVEAMMVAISTDAINWIELGTLSGQPTSIDIDGVAGVVAGVAYSYVRVTDDPNQGPGESVYSGADIDAVGAISSTDAPNTVPLPATGLMLVGALGALGAAHRRGREQS